MFSSSKPSNLQPGRINCQIFKFSNVCWVVELLSCWVSELLNWIVELLNYCIELNCWVVAWLNRIVGLLICWVERSNCWIVEFHSHFGSRHIPYWIQILLWSWGSPPHQILLWSCGSPPHWIAEWVCACVQCLISVVCACALSFAFQWWPGIVGWEGMHNSNVGGPHGHCHWRWSSSSASSP